MAEDLERKAFRMRKAELATALRRDTELTPYARLIGLEYLAWWGFERRASPIFDRKASYFRETIGADPKTLGSAKGELEAHRYFKFIRTGRADLVWPWEVAPQQQSLPFDGAARSGIFPDQIGKERRSRSGIFPDRIKRQTRTTVMEGRERFQAAVDRCQTSIVKRLRTMGLNDLQAWDLLQNVGPEELQRVCTLQLNDELAYEDLAALMQSRLTALRAAGGAR